MRTFVREKKVYCGPNYLEVDLFNYTKTEDKNARRGERSKKEVLSTQKQIDLNEQNSRRRFLQLVNTNFSENDLHVTLTYNKENLPPTFEIAEKDLKNFLRRVNYKRKKLGLEPLRYISIPVCVWKKDGITPARIHHHIIMHGGVDRDVIEDLWRKQRLKGHKKEIRIGTANAKRLQPEEFGMSTLCEYLIRQSGGKKRWNSSQNLDKPEKEVSDPDSPPRETESRFCASANLIKPFSRTNDHKFSRKEVERIAKSPPDLSYWERRYPGYTLAGEDCGFKAVYSEVRGWSIYLKLRRIR